MTQEWWRTFTCDRCGTQETVKHRCDGPDTEWPGGWRRFDRLHGNGKAKLDICPDCADRWVKWMAEVALR